MDLVASSLIAALNKGHSETFEPFEVCPPLVRRFSRDRVTGGRGFTADRLLGRVWDYPRYLKTMGVLRADLFHIVDHSYSHLVHALPHRRTIVTCHDLDAFRSVLGSEPEARSPAFRAMTRRILSGLRVAARVTCDSRAVRDEILRFGLVPAARLSVVHNGVSAVFTPIADGVADHAAQLLLRDVDPSVPVVLHVGSTIARKRIDVLLDVFARVRLGSPSALLVRVGGALTQTQAAHAHALGIDDAIVTLPFIAPEILAAVYRRASVVMQPSQAEGFGLPVAEAMACGTPVVASDLPVLREIGGTACTYCPVADVAVWAEAVAALLAERGRSTEQWSNRKAAAVEQAAQFTWSEYARRMADLYEDVLQS